MVIQQLKGCLYLLDNRAKAQFGLLGLMMLVAAGLETLSVGLVLPFLQLIEDPAQVAAFSTIPEDRLYATFEIPPFGRLGDPAYNGLREDRINCV